MFGKGKYTLGFSISKWGVGVVKSEANYNCGWYRVNQIELTGYGVLEAILNVGVKGTAIQTGL